MTDTTTDALRAKCAKQRDAILRLTREVEVLRADKSRLLFDLTKERAANAQLREAMMAPQRPGEAPQTAGSPLPGVPQPGGREGRSAAKKRG